VFEVFRVMAVPAQTSVVPVMFAGTTWKITDVVVAQTVGNVYVISAEPAVTPVTAPEDRSTNATEGSLG